MRVITYIVVTCLLTLAVTSYKTAQQEADKYSANTKNSEEQLHKILSERKPIETRVSATPVPTNTPTPTVVAQTPIATPKPVLKAVSNVPGNCEQYRPIIAQYGWNVDTAMFVMSKESGCNPNSVSSTNDHGLFQLNNQPVYDPAANVAIAYGKYVAGRIGANNWSAWYAVCTPGNNPQPKYPGINCQ